MLNGVVPSPTIRLRTGDAFQYRFRNGLREPSILHWHGLLVPDDADGHPRHAIDPGGTYDYAFPVLQRAGTYWYHPHAHHRTAAQVHLGMAGFLIVSDAEEEALGLPSGEQEILMVLQDRDRANAFAYAPTPTDLREGYLRDCPYGNGIPEPTVHVPGGTCRLRILNGSQARVYLLGFDEGVPFTIIGNDGGLLPAPVTVDSAYLGVGERLDCLVDLPPSGEYLTLSSRHFSESGILFGPGTPQGSEIRGLLVLRGTSRKVPGRYVPPAVLSRVAPLGAPVVTRRFAFSSAGGESAHWIAGRHFAMDRIDVRVPFAQVERWEFINDSDLPHPVHVHGCQFQVVERVGWRGQVFPYEGGWKDTALVMPHESVAIHICFNAYRGLYLLHCHNLQHEDQGMMLNIEVS